MTDSFHLADPAAARRYLNNFAYGTRQRGEHYYQDGTVQDLSVGEDGTRVAAEVQGSHLYVTSLVYNGAVWKSNCSCPMEADCKHAYAVMKTALSRQVVSAAKAKGKITPATKPAAAQPTGPLAAQLANAWQRKLQPDEARFVKKVQEVYRQCQTGQHITGYHLQQLAPSLHGISWQYLDLWPKFPKDEVEFWLYVAHELRERNAPIPDFMAPVTDFTAIEKIRSAWKRKQAIETWRTQLHHLSFQQPAAARGAVDFRIIIAKTDLRFEWKPAGDGVFQPLKQTQLKRFAEDFTHGHLDVTPDAMPLWQAFMGRWEFYRYFNFRIDSQEVARALNQVLRLPALHERILNGESLPFARPAEPLRWQLQPAEADTGDYVLRLALPDGTPLPPPLLTLRGHPTLYVTADTIFTGPPLALWEHVLESTKPNSIPAPALENRAGMEFLLKLGVDLPPRMEARTRRATMKVKIFCEIKPVYPGSSSEVIFIRIQAEPDAGDMQEIFTAAGWSPKVSAPEPPLKKADDVLFVYDRTAMGLFPSALDSLDAKWDNYGQCWRFRATKKFPEKFVPWVQSLHKDIEVNLDRELATLLRDPVAASVKLDCEAAGVDWFDLKVVLNVTDTELTQEELKLLLDARGGYVRLGKKGWRRLTFDLSDEDDERMSRLGLNPRDFSSEPQRLHALQLADDAAARLLPEQQVEEIRRRVGELKTRVSPPVPDAISAQLRPYQIEGFHFLAYLTENRFGGILADDMGLGKTVQTLTWLAWLRGRPGFQTQTSLVVCPKSVTDNWRAEAERFLPGLRVRIWRGSDTKAMTAALADTDLLVINYAQLRTLGESLGNIPWQAIILDEGQYIKNPESQTARVARSLKADYRLALSGTPIENRLLDLWSLMSFAMPGVLGNRTQFAKRFDQSDDPFARRRLAARVRPFLLRRTKGQVATELPDRIEEDLLCEMEGEQKTLYRAEFKRAQQMLLKMKTQKQFDKERFNFLTSLLRLRQICCHPALLTGTTKTAESAKLEALTDLLEPLIEEGHKVLVFSQFVSMLEILRATMKEKAWQHFYLAGDTENRGELVKEFQSAPGAAVFLISLKAGGFGLNLTAASYVVLFDPWWNPAVEMQAIDRTHRIGQTSKVIAYRLLIKESIEEKIRALQRTKSALAHDVLGEENFGSSLTLQDLQFLFADDPK